MTAPTAQAQPKTRQQNSLTSTTIQSSNRVFICGKTGSGKTTLARELCKGLNRLVVLDSKATLTDWGLDDWGDKRYRRKFAKRGGRLRALAPIHEDPLEYWIEVLSWIWEQGNITCYIDELFAVVPPRSNPPHILNSLYTRGREFGIGMWASTQRPASVPLMTISESEFYLMFRLSLGDDRKRMAEFMTDAVLEPIKDVHGFYFMRAQDDAPTYIPEYRLGGKRG